jgi:hypothetical protein
LSTSRGEWQKDIRNVDELALWIKQPRVDF